ncbi:MAG: hypothetical protein M3Y37_03775 [Chloroflexota bacterium]|nr:hypothetical protein [Chloroflexota bacterium]
MRSLVARLRRPDSASLGILLVEGVNDVGTFKALLAKVPGTWKPTKDQEFLILPLGGNTLVNGTREDELREFTRLNHPKFVAVIDSERTGPDDPPDKAHAAFKALCDRIGLRCYVLERRSIECYFDDAAIQAVYGPTFSAFGAYGTQPYGWHNQQNAAVARAMTMDSIAGTDLERILQEL